MTSRSDVAERAWRARETGRMGIALGLLCAENLGVTAMRGQPFGSWIWANAVMVLTLVVSLIMIVRGFCASDDLGRKPHAMPRGFLVVFGLLWLLMSIGDGVQGQGADALVRGVSSALAFACAAWMWRRARRAVPAGEFAH